MKTTAALLLTALLALAVPAWAQDPFSPESSSGSGEKEGGAIEIDAGQTSFQGGIATAEDDVVVHMYGDVIYCDRFVYDAETKTAYCKGNVRIFTQGTNFRGDTFIYNFETKQIMSADFRMANYPLLIAGEEITTPGLDHYRVYDGFFTTENRNNPAWRFRASQIEIYREDEVVLKNVVLYVGQVPVMWLPIYVQSLKDDREGYQFGLGYSDRMGAFWLNRYNFLVGEQSIASLRFDMRSERGFAGGGDWEYFHNDFNKLYFQAYFAKDNLYDNIPPGGTTLANSTSSYQYPNVDTNNRYRVKFQERFEVGGDLNVVANVNKWSDPWVTADFFPAEFRQDVQPDNFVAVQQYNPNFDAYVLARAQVNGFFTQTERKPDAVLDIRPQKIFGTDLEYVSNNSVTSFAQRYANGPNGVNIAGNFLSLPEYDAYRWQTFHQLSYPGQYFNWLNVNPKLGIRGVWYSNNNQNNDNISDNPKAPINRVIPNLGLDLNFRVSRTWSDVKNEELGIDGLRHVAQPFANTLFIPQISGPTAPQSLVADSTVDGFFADDVALGGGQFRGFDTRLPSDQLQPIDMVGYNSIDSINDFFVVRYGINNKLQTNRDGRNWNLIDWSVYADLDIRRNFGSINKFTTNPNGSINITQPDASSNVYSDLEINPLPWLAFESFASINVAGDNFSFYNNQVRWQVNRALEVAVGNRYITDSVLFPNSNLVYGDLFYRMNEHWQFSGNISYDTIDGRMPNASLTIYRDLSAWQVALTLARREINFNQTDNVVFLTFTLKAFPQISLSTGEFGAD